MEFKRVYRTEPGLCFVIMPFMGELKSVYEFVIKPFVEKMGMVCLRADEIYGGRPIMEDVWRGIQRAEIVMADLTGRNPNVMYELGLCHALWKKLILISQNVDDVPFDLKGYRLIPYEPSIGGAERLKESLASTIEAIRKEPTTEGAIVPFEQPSFSEPTLAKVSGTVEAVTKIHLTIRLNDGRLARMATENYVWTARGKDLTREFRVGDSIWGVLLSETTTPVEFSIKHQWPDPWPDFQSGFPVGTKFTGRVVNVIDAGAFVEVKRFFNGMMPKNRLPIGETLGEHDEVEAVIKTIDVPNRHILLDYVRKVSSWADRAAKYSVGGTYPGRVTTAKDAYLVVELEPGFPCIAHKNSFPADAAANLDQRFPLNTEAHWVVKTIDNAHHRVELGPAEVQAKVQAEVQAGAE